MASKTPISCRLEIQPPSRLRFELANSSESALWVLKWNTPLEGWKGTVLKVTRDGKEVPYQGRMFKRGDPGRDDYVEIPAGGKVDATVDLAEVYDVSRPGTYKVEADGDLIDVTAETTDGTDAIPRPRDRHQGLPLRCKAVTFRVP
jgi:hypothetical protein